MIYCLECKKFYDFILFNIKTIYKERFVCICKSKKNKYDKQIYKSTYAICPKGHKTEILIEKV